MLRAKLHAREMRYVEAARDIEDVLRAAALIRKEVGLARGLVAGAMGALACRSARFVATRERVAPEAIERLLRALGPPGEEADLFAAGLRSLLDYMVDLVSLAGTKGEGLEAFLAISTSVLEPEGFEDAHRAVEALLEGHRRPFDVEDTVRLAAPPPYVGGPGGGAGCARPAAPFDAGR